MSASFYDLLKYAATGQASHDMTYYDKMRASTLMGGVVRTLTGQTPLTFKADGTPLISWSMKGNDSQTGTPTPDAPIMPDFVGVRTGNLFDESTAVYGKYIGSNGIERTSSSGVTNHSDYITVQENTSYTISGTKPTYGGIVSAISWYDADKQFIVRNSYTVPNEAGRFSWAAVSPNDAAFAIINFMRYPDYDGEDDMLNLGSTALPYEPYGYKIPITCGGETTPIYLGEVPTVRRVKKLVLTGEEKIESYQGLFYIQLPSDAKSESNAPICTHFLGTKETTLENYCIRQMVTGYWGGQIPALQLKDSSHSTQSNLRTYFSTQYANGTPVCVWYVLANEQTGIANEPLCKIGDYADELHSTDAAVPTVKGANTLTVETELQPSEMSITYRG